MADSTSSLVIKIDGTQAKKIVDQLRQGLADLTNQGNKAGQSTSDLSGKITVINRVVNNYNNSVNTTNNRITTLNRTQQTYNNTTNNTTSNLNNLNRTINNTTNNINQLNRAQNNANSGMTAMSGSMSKLIALMGSYLGISQAIAKIDEYTMLNNRLRLVTNSQLALNTAMQDTFAIAQKTGADWGATASIYQKVQYNSEKLRLSQQGVAQVSELISKSIANSGSSAQAASAALYQLGQSFDKSSLNGDEFVSISENAGYLMEVFAKGLGVTRAELKQMSSDGQLTTDKMVKAIQNMAGSIEKDFGKTNFTIGQAFQYTSNEVTKFIGEADKANGASVTLGTGIRFLGDNLGTLANGAMIAGVAYLTKTIATQTMAIQASIVASAARRAQDVAALQATVAATIAEVQKARATVGSLAAERNLIIAKLQGNVTTQQRIVLETRATQVAVQLALAERGLTSAVATRTAAQNALNTSMALSSRLMTLVGGPIGLLTIGVTALAAGYMYMQGKAAQASAEIERQGKVADTTKEKLLALKGLEKDKSIDDMTASIKRQNEALAESSSKVNLQLDAVKRLYSGNAEIVKIVEAAKNGTITMTEATKRFNDLRINKEIYESFKANSLELDKNTLAASTTQRSLKFLGIEVKLAGNASQNAAVQHAQQKDELNGVASAANKAANSVDGYIKAMGSTAYTDAMTLGYMKKGFSLEQAKAIAGAWTEAQKDSAIVTQAQEQQILKNLEATKAVNDFEEKRKEKIKEQTKELKDQTKEAEKQLKTLQASGNVKANAARYNFAGLESKYGLPNSALTAIHAIETGNTGKTNQVNKETGATGGFQFLPATAKQYGVTDRTNMSQAAEGAAKYLSYLLKMFDGNLEKAVRAYHAGEGNVQKGTNIGKFNNDYWKKFQGYVGGSLGFSGTPKDFDNNLKLQQKFDEEKLRIDYEYGDRAKKANIDLQAEIARLTVANKSEYIKVAQDRVRQESEIHDAQLAYDLYSFKMNEEEKLTARARIDAMMIRADREATDEEKLSRRKALAAKVAYDTQIMNLNKQNEARTYKEETDDKFIQIAQARALYAAPVSNRQKLSMQFAEGNENRANDNALFGTRSTLEAQLAKNEILQSEYNKRIEDAVLLHEQNKAKIREDYAVQYDDLQKMQQQAQLSMYSSMLSSTQNVWGEMTNIIKDAHGETSSAYKTMFALQKAMAIAQTIIQTNLASIGVMNDPSALTLAQKVMYSSIIRATGYASAGMIAAQTIAGFADGGYTGSGGKWQEAGVVHKGEVVWSQADIARWGGVGVVESMRTSKPIGYADGGMVDTSSYIVDRYTQQTAQPIVNIYTDQGLSVEQKKNEDGSLDVFVRKIAQEEVKRGFSNLGNNNSYENKQIQRNFNVEVKR